MDDEKLAQKLQEEEDNGGRRTRGGRSSKKTPVVSIVFHQSVTFTIQWL